MSAYESIEAQIKRASDQRAELQAKLSTTKRGKWKIRSQINKLNREIKKLSNILKKMTRQDTRLEHRNERQENRMDRDIVGFENGFNPIADRWGGMADLTTAGTSGIANLMMGIGAMKHDFASSNAGVFNRESKREEFGRGALGDNMMYIVLLGVVLLMALGSKGRR